MCFFFSKGHKWQETFFVKKCHFYVLLTILYWEGRCQKNQKHLPSAQTVKGIREKMKKFRMVFKVLKQKLQCIGRRVRKMNIDRGGGTE